MDESYLQWLQWIPGIGSEKAQRIAERFPTFEHLRAATREELSTVEGLSEGEIDALERIARDRSGRDGSGHLFLCPECGSFAGAGSKSCPVCGVGFEESVEAGLSRDVDVFLSEEDHPAAICLTCGAAMRSGRLTCDVCGRQYAAEELALLPGLDAFLDEAAPLCPHCGAYLYGGAAECTICGRGTAAIPEATANGHREKGIGRGFLSRWQKVAELSTASPEDRLREELENCDRLLDADSTLERTWAKRGRVLGELGRLAEATDSLRKAAKLNPQKEEEYRLEALNLLRAHGDTSFLPPEWQQPAATAAPRKADERLLDALRHYDALLRVDPSSGVAWRTKGEILERLGQSAESREALARADWLERHEGHTLKAAVSGLQSRGLVPARLTEGRTNGRVNGRTNGRVNGFTNGRVNGLTNGTRNGLDLGLGRTNGLSGRGRTNGLVNGDGFTNGRRGRYGLPSVPSQPHWARSVVGIAAVVALMILAPILASLMSPSPALAETIRIDHDFGDWLKYSAYNNSAARFSSNPDVNLVQAKVAAGEYDLFVYARVQGSLFRGFQVDETDTLFVFLDEDGSRATGYPVGDLGADLLAEVTGWDGAIQHVARYAFNRTGVATSNDWNRFRGSGSLSADFSGQELEMRIPVSDPSKARVLLYGADNLGARSPMDGSIQADRPTVVVEQQSVADDILTNLTSAVLRVGLTPMGGTVVVDALNVSRVGTSTDPVGLFVYLDDGSGSFDAADAFLSSTTVSGTRGSLPVARPLAGPAILWLVAGWTNMTPASTFGVRVDDLWASGFASFRPPETGFSYLASAPSMPVVDGAFGDWRGRPYGQDLLGDVVNRSGAIQYNANVDLLRTAFDVAVDFTAFLQVDGRVLGGEDIPVERVRTTQAPSGGNISNVSQPLVIQEGVDVLYAYIDSDNATTTGVWANAENRTYGFDRVLAITGRNGAVTSSGLYAYAPANGSAWQYAGPVDAALDARRLEFRADASALGLQPGYRVVFYAADWRLEYDVALPDVAVARFALAARAATNVVINEVSPQPNPEWIEVANPTGSAVLLAGWDLAIQRGNRLTVVFTFTTQVLGPWGSGTEYLRVFVPNNSLPNGNVAMILRQNLVVIDQTIYSQSVANGQSWSRLKDPLTGVPMDTDNDAADFYISLAPSPGGPNDRHRPDILVAKTASAAVQTPGDVLTYTLYYNNTGVGIARRVQIDDALPAGVTFLGANPAPTSGSGSNFQWVFANVAPGSHSLTITVEVNGNGADGSLQVNVATLTYTDQLNRPLPGSQAWANFTVARPMVAIAKAVSPASAGVGDTVTFTIYYNNTGSLPAGTVTIKDVLPTGLTLTGSNPAPSGVSGQTLWWNFTNVAVGSHSITLTATVNAQATGSQLVNWVFLNYTTMGGYALPSSVASATLAIPELSDFAIVVVVPLLIVAMRLRASRRRRAGVSEREGGVADSVPWTDGR